MGTIGDSPIHDDLDVESPEWHGDVLSARKNKIEEGRADYMTMTVNDIEIPSRDECYDR
jgi:hypothetical protein